VFSLLLVAVATRVRRRAGVVVVLVGAAVMSALVVPSVYARGQAAPVNAAAPTIDYPPGVGNYLTPRPGSWSNSPTSFTYQWLRCPRDGAAAGGSGCAAFGGPATTAFTQLMDSSDVDTTWRTRVTATNGSGSASAVSSATPAVQNLAQNITGCPDVHGAGTVHVDEFVPPARLVVDQRRMTPSVITRNTQRITLRIHVIASDDRAVIGALVYATPTPFNQFTGVERPTDATGWATLTLTRQRGFLATSQQRNLIVFVRARKPGEDLLGGISSRRLVSFPVRL
jgi:hypothetical protein